MFRWLIIQSTFKIDSIPCNCVCIFKTFSEQYVLNYCIEKKKCSSFIETYRVFRERQKRVSQHFSTISMSGENLDVCPDGMHLIFWRPWTLFQHVWTERFNFSWHLINICLLHSHFCTSITFFCYFYLPCCKIYPFTIPQKCPLPGKTHSRRSREHSIGGLFIYLSVLKMKETVLYFQCLFYTSIACQRQWVVFKKDFEIFFPAHCL